MEDLQKLGVRYINWVGLEDDYYHFHLIYNDEIIFTSWVERAEDLEPTIVEYCKTKLKI